MSAMKNAACLALLMLTICSPAMTRASERTKHVNANGYTFTYVEAGKGEPVILVHGALADYRSAGEVAERLATRFRVIRYSRRYHYPDKPAQISDYSPDVHARDLVALIRALHLDRVHLVGHSYGGVVAMLAAASAPDLIRTVTLEEPALMSFISGTDVMEQQKKARATVVADIRQKFNAGEPNPAADEFIDWVRGNDGRFPSPSEQKQMAYDNETTLLPMLDGPAATFNCEAAQRFSRPSLLLYGEHTRPWYRAVVMSLSKCLPNAEASQISKSTHFVEEDNPTGDRRRDSQLLRSPLWTVIAKTLSL